MKTEKVPVKLRITRVDLGETLGVAHGRMFLPKVIDGHTTYPENRKHAFRVKFERDTLRTTDVFITGDKSLDLCVFEAIEKDVVALIEGWLAKLR